MSERDAFGPTLRRVRVQRGISLGAIAAATKISTDLLSGLERNDFSRWPSGIYARAYIRAYATEIGVDADTTVDDFCRWFPQGDRRAERVVREQAAIVGHDLRWKDDLVGMVVENDRRSRPSAMREEDVPALAFTKIGRVVAALADLSAVFGASFALSALLPIGRAGALATCAIVYHAATLATLGCTPAVWVIDTYLVNRHPTAGRPKERFLRLLRNSERVNI